MEAEWSLRWKNARVNRLNEHDKRMQARWQAKRILEKADKLV